MGNIHVMDSKELTSVPDGTVIWMENRIFQTNPLIPEMAHLQPLVMYNGVYGNYFSYMLPDDIDNEADVRFWNYRPTIETMNNTPW